MKAKEIVAKDTIVADDQDHAKMEQASKEKPLTHVVLVAVNRKLRINCYSNKDKFSQYLKQVKRTGFMYRSFVTETGSEVEKEFMTWAMREKDNGEVSNLAVDLE